MADGGRGRLSPTVKPKLCLRGVVVNAAQKDERSAEPSKQQTAVGIRLELRTMFGSKVGKLI